MPRQRLASGTVGTISVLPLGFNPSDPDKREVVIPQPATDGGDKLEYPKGMTVGSVVKIETPDGMAEYQLSRWRGMVRVRDIDDKTYQVRRWAGTKEAARTATKTAADKKLIDLQRERTAAAEATAVAADGDRTTTVTDLVMAVMRGPEVAKLSAKTQQDYGYASAHIIGHPIGASLPREVDVAAVRAFLADCAVAHGTGGTKHARAVLARAMDLAVGTRALRVSMNPVLGARNAIPKVVVRETGLDHSKAMTDEQVRNLLSALTRDPEARAMYPGTGRRKSPHGQAGTVVNGTDIADLGAVMFATGSRVGETAGLRWSDFDPRAGTVMISGTLVSIAGSGTARQVGTKTAGSKRLVPVAPWALNALIRRARRFGVDLADRPDSPIFGSPQFPDRWRDLRNLSRAISTLFTRHGVEWGRGHSGRKWRVTSLVERGVPIHKVSDLVGHVSVATTQGYLGRGRQTDDDVRAAL